jgi:hypothetical protein
MNIVAIFCCLNIASSVGMQYCPFCGRKLEELIETSRPAFERLALEHEKFDPGL